MSDTPVPEELVDGLTLLQFKALIADLNPNRIAQRSQSGSKLSYLEAWDVRASLIRIFGFGGWDAEVIDKQVIDIERDIPKTSGGTTAFRATAMVTVRLTIHQLGAVYAEVAASSQSGAVIGDVLDFALKTAASDALKRCAMNLGTQFGLSLYNAGNPRDIVRVVLDPKQSVLAERLKVMKEVPKDVTPDDAVVGVGEVETLGEPETPAPATKPRATRRAPVKAGTVVDEVAETLDYLVKAKNATTADDIGEIWREAKSGGAKPEVLANLAKLGAERRAIEAQEFELTEKAKKDALDAMTKGFGGDVPQ